MVEYEVKTEWVECKVEKNVGTVIIKHANPCGVAMGDTSLDAFKKALKCDPVSAFGGIIALNCELDGITAKTMGELFMEVIIAPSVSEEAQKILSGKKKIKNGLLKIIQKS